MGFIWFFFMIFTMGSASRFVEHIENETLRGLYRYSKIYEASNDEK